MKTAVRLFARAACFVACLGALPPALAASGLDTQARPLDAVAGSRDERAVAERIAAAYAGFAGSHENAMRLVKGMRSGKVIALRTQARDEPAELVAFNAGSGPMSLADVNATLERARASLARAGVTRPGASEIQAAVAGGAIAREGRSESVPATAVASASPSATATATAIANANAIEPAPAVASRVPTAWGRYRPMVRVSRTFESLPGIQ